MRLGRLDSKEVRTVRVVLPCTYRCTSLECSD